MFFTVKKFQKRVVELEQMRYVDMVTLAPFVAMPGQLGADEVYCKLPDYVDGATLHIDDLFEGRDRYLWVQKQVTIPACLPSCEVVGLFDFGKTGNGHNSGFESLLYVDGQPYQGVDTNHNDVVFTQLAGQQATLTFLLWTGLEGGGPHQNWHHRIRRADIGHRHQPTNTFYYLARAITETLEFLPDEAPERHSLISALDEALRLVDWDVDRFYSTIVDALAVLEKKLKACRKDSAVTVHAIGHTHIDVAWLWRLKHSREKAIRSFSTVTRLMQEYDEYKFLQTQPQLYKYIKSDCPELYTKIKENICAGKWEVDGGMWVEADCNITSGESLVRQFLHGIKFIKDEFGVDCQYLWLPDVFGYSWALPQILQQCNLKTFMTTKISWNQYNVIPNDLFFWRGIDGSEILTYFIDTPEVGHMLDRPFSTYNGMMTAHSVMGSWKKFKNKNISNDVLLAYGYGDGGGGVSRDMLEMRRALDALPGVPNVQPNFAVDFFDKLHNTVNHTTEYMPVWDGELYLEYHRGTYTSQAKTKRNNRKLEYKLATTEWLSCLAMLSGGSYDDVALHDGWECLLRNQFHDIIPGSSIAEVYADADKEYQAVHALLEKVHETALGTLCTHQKDSHTLINFSSFTSQGLVYIPEDRVGHFVDEDGRGVLSQKCEEGYMVEAKLSHLSIDTIRFVAGAGTEDNAIFEVNLEAGKLHTPYYDIAFEKSGVLSSVYDKVLSREVLLGQGNLLEVYEDKPMTYDAWDIDIFHIQKKEDISACGQPVVLENGPLRIVLEFVYRYRASVIRQKMALYAHSKRIDFETYVDWHESNRLLKVAFDVNIRATKATYDIQFGHVERPTHWNTSWDWARFEVCGHKWADVSETGYGVSLMNDCKYGYSVHDNTMRLSLLKSSKTPDTQADMGEHSFVYALYPHVGGVADGGTIEASNALNIPILVATNSKLHATKKLVNINSDAVLVDAVKKCEKDSCIILRIHECRGGTHNIEITSDLDIKRVVACNLLEQETDTVCECSSICCTIKPFEIKTFKLWM